MLDASYFEGIRGAVYFPSRAYNAWQTWNELNPEEIDRDFGYAEDAGINALRMFVSFEYWQERPEEFFKRFEQVIALSEKHGIRIMPVLFEDCGTDNTEENRKNKNPHSWILPAGWKCMLLWTLLCAASAAMKDCWPSSA